jgi:diamine N-acetyltransferase
VNISLRAIDRNNWEECASLSLGPAQQDLVQTNIRSLAECFVRPEAKPLAIYDGDAMVGFLMYLRSTDTQLYHIHRIMVDFHYQGRGIGRKALGLAIELIRKLPDRSDKLVIMFLEYNLAAESLYKKLGFVDSGQTIINEKRHCDERIFYYYF